jgi:hypothetical protein
MYTHYLQFNALENIKKYQSSFPQVQSTSALKALPQGTDVFEYNIHFGAGKPTPILKQNPVLASIISDMVAKNLKKNDKDEASITKAKEAVYRAAQTYAALKKANIASADSRYTHLNAPETAQGLNLDGLDMTAEEVRGFMEEVGRECVNYAAQCARSMDTANSKTTTAERVKSYLKVTPNQKDKLQNIDKRAKKLKKQKKLSKMVVLKLPSGASFPTINTNASIAGESEPQQNTTIATLASGRSLRNKPVKPGAYTVDSVPIDAFDETEDSSNESSDNDSSGLSTLGSIEFADEIRVGSSTDSENEAEADNPDVQLNNDESEQVRVPRKSQQAKLESKEEKDAIVTQYLVEKTALEKEGKSTRGLQAKFLSRMNAERRANSRPEIIQPTFSRWLSKLPSQEVVAASKPVSTELVVSQPGEVSAHASSSDEVELNNPLSQKEHHPMSASAPELMQAMRTFAKPTFRITHPHARPAANMMPATVLAAPMVPGMQSSADNQISFMEEDSFSRQSQIVPSVQHRVQPFQPLQDVNTNNWVQQGIKVHQSKHSQKIQEYFQKLEGYARRCFPQEPEKQARYLHAVRSQVKAFLQQPQSLANPVRRQMMQPGLPVFQNEVSVFPDMSFENLDFSLDGSLAGTAEMPPPPAPHSRQRGATEQVRQWQANIMAQQSDPQTPNVDEDTLSYTTGTSRMGDLDITSRGSSVAANPLVRKRTAGYMSQDNVSSASSDVKGIKPKDLAGFYKFAKKDAEDEEFFVKKMIRTLIRKFGFEDKLSTDLKDVDVDIDDESIFSTLDEDHAAEVNRLLPLPEKPTLSQRSYLESLKKKLPAAILNNKRPRVVTNQEDQT